MLRGGRNGRRTFLGYRVKNQDINEQAEPGAAGYDISRTDPAVLVVDAIGVADWGALATGRATLVFRRGLPQLLQIVARLIAAGMARSTPAAVVCLAPQDARPAQPAGAGASLGASLSELPARIAGEPLPATALIVVGALAEPGCALGERLGGLLDAPAPAERAAA